MKGLTYPSQLPFLSLPQVSWQAPLPLELNSQYLYLKMPERYSKFHSFCSARAALHVDRHQSGRHEKSPNEESPISKSPLQVKPKQHNRPNLEIRPLKPTPQLSVQFLRLGLKLL